MDKRIYGVIAVAVAVLALIYLLNSATEVEVITVAKGDIQHTVIDTGYVQAAEYYDLYAEQGARISRISTSVGQSIQKGQSLMVLENLDLSMGSNQLQISLNQAKGLMKSAQAEVERSSIDLQDAENRLTRIKELYAAGAVSKTEYDETSSLVDKYRSILAEQTEKLKITQMQVDTYAELLSQSQQKQAQLVVKSPISGTLMQLPVLREQVVQPGTLLARVAVASQMEIKADILSDDLGEVRVGQRVQITAPVMGETVLDGEIVKIYPQAEEKQSALGVVQRRVPVIIAMENDSNLKPGYETRVRIITDSREDVLLVPREAIISVGNNQQQVMLINNGRVTFREVKIGLRDSKNVEIITGLQAGDQIIKDASIGLEENARVKLKKI
ncbi:MAG: efflux RND transporter periplasmic adaptor subunit [Syntrophomonas sp.]|nr:efflux RND transporter periplasmic adaptor subunit [Syntrophomonas sp.]